MNICCSWVWRKILSHDLRNSRDHCSYNWFSSVITIFVHVDILTLLYTASCRESFQALRCPSSRAILRSKKSVHDFPCPSNSRYSAYVSLKRTCDFFKFAIHCHNEWKEIRFATNKYSSIFIKWFLRLALFYRC